MSKKFIIVGIVLVLIFIIFSFLKADRKIVNYPTKNNTVVAFGDSLVEGIGSSGGGFVSILSKKIGRPIVNLGVSGNTTSQGLNRIDDVLSIDAGIVIVLLGGNDYLRKVSKEETFQNLKQIISKIQSSGSMVILLGVRGGILSDGFESSFENLAEETGSIYVPDVLDGIILNRDLMYDAIHPNDLGYQKIAEKVYKGIKNYIK